MYIMLFVNFVPKVHAELLHSYCISTTNKSAVRHILGIGCVGAMRSATSTSPTLFAHDKSHSRIKLQLGSRNETTADSAYIACLAKTKLARTCERIY